MLPIISLDPFSFPYKIRIAFNICQVIFVYIIAIPPKPKHQILIRNSASTLFE
jgi:hypothetical protein